MRSLLVFVLLVLACPLMLIAQGVRSLNNEGVELYKQNKFTDAEVNFRKGIEQDSLNFQAAYNLGSAYYKQKKFDEAVKAYKNALAKTTDRLLQSKTWYNSGNALLDGGKLQEAVEAYKQSLRLNPHDADAKYNLSYALEKLKNKNNQNQNQNQNKNDKDKNKDKNNNQNNDQQKDKKDNDKNKDGQENKDNQGQNKQDDKNSGQGNPKISRDEAERVLEAMKNNEKDLQKKLRKKEGTRVKIEKDW